MAAKLIAEEGTLKGLTLSLENGEQWIIGRDPDSCQLLIEDPTASRRHLLCRTSPQGIIVENLSATNPIEVNGEEVKRNPRILEHSDLVKIGGSLFRFYEETEARLFNEEDPNKEKEKEKPAAELPKPEEEEVEEESDFPDDDISFVEETSIHEDAESESESVPEPDTSHEEAKEEVEEEPASPKQKEPEHEEVFSEENLSSPEPKSGFSRHDSIFEDKHHEDDLFPEINFDVLDTGRWLLKVIGGPNTGAEFTMKTGSSYIVGTDPQSCDVIFNDTSVSRQHAKVNISEEDIITIEDLQSRNGTLVDGNALKGKLALDPNLVVNLGTSAFVIYDKEGEMHTIISPLLPSIVKVLQREEVPVPQKAPVTPEPTPEETQAKEEAEEKISDEIVKEIKEKSNKTLTAFILIAIITGTFVLTGIGMITLFQTNPIEMQDNADSSKILKEALSSFPGVEYTFNKSTGTLMLIGHVLTDNGKRQIRYNLQGLPFIKNVDSTGIIIDEKVWQDLNPTLARDPAWRGITLQANTPGKFVLKGSLKTRAQMESLIEYMSRNFPYLDLLEYNVLVEEDVMTKVKLELAEAGIPNLNVSMSNGDLVISGVIPSKAKEDYQAVITKVAATPGLRNIRDFVTVVREANSTIDVSDRYLVTGVSRSGGKLSVLIDGKIIFQGDILDGMRVTSITPHEVLLEKDNITYKIELGTK